MTPLQQVSKWLGAGYQPCEPEAAARLAREVVAARIRRRQATLTEDPDGYCRDLQSYATPPPRAKSAAANTEPLRSWAIDTIDRGLASAEDLSLIAEGDLDIDPDVRCVDMTLEPSVGASVVAWRGLVASVAYNDFRQDLRRCKAIDMSDLLQEGAEILRRAVIRYNPDAFAFTTYATTCLSNGLLKVIERYSGPVRLAFNHSKGGRMNVSSYASRSRGGIQLIDGSTVAASGGRHGDDDADSADLEVTTYKEEQLEQLLTDRSIGQSLDKVIDNLPITERRAVVMYYVDGLSHKQIAERWVDLAGKPITISGERARQLCKLGVERIRRAMIPFMEP